MISKKKSVGFGDLRSTYERLFQRLLNSNICKGKIYKFKVWGFFMSIWEKGGKGRIYQFVMYPKPNVWFFQKLKEKGEKEITKLNWLEIDRRKCNSLRESSHLVNEMWSLWSVTCLIRKIDRVNQFFQMVNLFNRSWDHVSIFIRKYVFDSPKITKIWKILWIFEHQKL